MDWHLARLPPLLAMEDTQIGGATECPGGSGDRENIA
jgi:hypothetical protein